MPLDKHITKLNNRLQYASSKGQASQSTTLDTKQAVGVGERVSEKENIKIKK